MYRANYWSCSKFANWIRGTDKPEFLEIHEWKNWRENSQSKHSTRYWIAEDGLDMLQNIVYWIPDQLQNVKYYINNRWVSKKHYLKTGLKPGEWHEFDTRLMHGMFNELVEFVEIECAWHHVHWDKTAREKYHTPWWAKRRWYRNWRCAKAGIEYLNWAASLIADDSYCDKDDPNYGLPTAHALAAKKTLELYYWWTTVRPARLDPYEESGWSKYCSEQSYFKSFSEKSPEEKEETQSRLDALTKLENKYNEEDTSMMIDLVKLRASLWT